MTGTRRDVILIRSLADSDLGLFSSHRASATSKQRAIAITSPAARMLLSPRLHVAKGTEFDFICVYGAAATRELRHVSKVGKNWRLGGRKLAGSEFAFLDSRDFALVRSVRNNDGDSPMMMTFVGRQRERLVHAGIVAMVGERLRDGVAVVPEGSDAFEALASAFPCVPAIFALGPPYAPESEDGGKSLLLSAVAADGR
ncbi:hypothetical protein [Methylobacterium sp. Leaf117]|uniref:hypothetical protein n=1 Tax=Methylobacterium sp. Leaf117 TaxID=1736260 RepID=UPI0006FF340F|nr:hypothetical protein [Methylobacterium sp. Leaf117]KQP91931.1 hypothetical protein ASF57_05470 [Methylobacterium sp. Leaf117]